MGILQYDAGSDSLYVNVSSKKAYLTAELSSRIGVDVSEEGRAVGVEILGASKVISDLFHRKISKEQVGKLLCTVSESDAIYLDFQLEKEHTTLAIPKAYKSPLLTSPA